MPKRCLMMIGLVVALLAFLYSLMGVAMAYWVASLPDQTPEHIRLNFMVWVPAALLTLALCFWFAVRLFTRGST